MSDNKVKPPLDIEQIKRQLTSQPQIQELLVKMRAFWLVYGLKVKIGAGILGILLLVIIAIQIGGNIAGLNRPLDRQPAAIPTVATSPEQMKVSVFAQLKEQIKAFSPLLPDPAPPGVDPNITLKAPTR